MRKMINLILAIAIVLAFFLPAAYAHDNTAQSRPGSGAQSASAVSQSPMTPAVFDPSGIRFTVLQPANSALNPGIVTVSLPCSVSYKRAAVLPHYEDRPCLTVSVKVYDAETNEKLLMYGGCGELVNHVPMDLMHDGMTIPMEIRLDTRAVSCKTIHVVLVLSISGGEDDPVSVIGSRTVVYQISGTNRGDYK